MDAALALALLSVPSKWLRWGRVALLLATDDWDDDEGDREGRAAAAAAAAAATPLDDIYCGWVDGLEQIYIRAAPVDEEMPAVLPSCPMDGGREKEKEKGLLRGTRRSGQARLRNG